MERSEALAKEVKICVRLSSLFLQATNCCKLSSLPTERTQSLNELSK